MNFAHVKDGGIVHYLHELPFTFNGVTRFRSLTPEQQAAAGILPVVDQTPALDADAERLANAPLSVTVYPDRVEILRAVRPLSEEEKEARGAERSASDLDAKRVAALRALDDLRLAEAAKDPDAPQAVKDYNAEPARLVPG